VGGLPVGIPGSDVKPVILFIQVLPCCFPLNYVKILRHCSLIGWLRIAPR